MEKQPQKITTIVPDSLNPNKIVEQSGPDAGRIADASFAQAIAIELNKRIDFANRNLGVSPHDPEDTAMQQEIYRRINREIGPADTKLKLALIKIVQQKVKEQIKEKTANRRDIADEYIQNLLDEFSKVD